MAAMLRGTAYTVLAIAWAFFPRASCQNTFPNGTVSHDAYFYGKSPPVYPSPTGSGLGRWAASYAKAAALVAQLSLAEKVNITGGSQDFATSCAGSIAPNDRIGFPGWCLQDAGNGVRATDFVNGYPGGLHVGASWNKDLAHLRAVHIGNEYRTKGVNVALGPVVGPLGRITEGGRNWEGFTNDPYLSGQLAAETVKGIQSTGVITSLKHYIGNEQETNRNPSNVGGQYIESVSSNIDDKTLHELYLWPFQDGVYAGTGNIMCSYNRINGSHGCQNSKILNGVLKGELGFQGFVVSDWGAQHSGVASALAGLDVVMPSATTFWGSHLINAVNNGSIPESRIDDMATRILATWYQLGQDSGFPARGVGMPVNINLPHTVVDARNPASKPILFDGAVEGHVLVKNTNGALPLKSPRLLSIFGYDAKAPDTYSPSPSFQSGWPIGNEPLNGSEALTTQIGSLGTLILGGGSGAVTPAYWNSPYDAIQQRAYDDSTSLFWDFITIDSTSTVDPATDAALVFINAWASEGKDRPGLHDDFSDALVQNIAAQSNNTIVVIHNAGIRLVDQWADNPNVTAIIYAHVPGQDSGRALVSLLYGDSNFSGKLPYTVAHNESDYGNLLTPTQPTGEYILFPDDDFTEGVYIDHRAFDKYNITPRYEFGFGLSYTTFTYSNLSIAGPSPTQFNTYPTGPILPGGAADLWTTVANVAATVSNTGDTQGQEVAQLYVGIPGTQQPVRQLRGFEKLALAPGQAGPVDFALTRRDLSVWDVETQKWALQTGEYRVYVGGSSRELPLVGTLTI